MWSKNMEKQLPSVAFHDQPCRDVCPLCFFKPTAKDLSRICIVSAQPPSVISQQQISHEEYASLALHTGTHIKAKTRTNSFNSGILHLICIVLDKSLLLIALAVAC